MLKINKEEAIEIVKKLNQENRYRDGGKINNAIDMVVKMAEEMNKLKKSIKDVVLECAEEMTQEMEDNLLYGRPTREPLKDKINVLEEELKKEKEKNKILETLLQGNLYEMYKYYRELASKYQANSISKDDLKEIIYPTPENLISIETQTSDMYRKLEELLEENNEM